MEVKALKKIRRKAKKSLITFLLTFKLSSDHYLILPWAEGGNLLDLCQSKEIPENDESWSYWLAEQCAELADGLSDIHDTRMTLDEIPAALKMTIPEPDPQQVPSHGYHQDESDFGRHGDIKPPNILWFSNEKNNHNHGVLRLADFGLTTFHREHTTKVLHAEVRGFTSTYQAPEHILNYPDAGQVTYVSRKVHVWSLGYVYVEFITWGMMGNDGVERFRNQRMEGLLPTCEDGQRTISSKFCHPTKMEYGMPSSKNLSEN